MDSNETQFFVSQFTLISCYVSGIYQQFCYCPSFYLCNLITLLILQSHVCQFSYILQKCTGQFSTCYKIQTIASYLKFSQMSWKRSKSPFSFWFSTKWTFVIVVSSSAVRKIPGLSISLHIRKFARTMPGSVSRRNYSTRINLNAIRRRTITTPLIPRGLLRYMYIKCGTNTRHHISRACVSKFQNPARFCVVPKQSCNRKSSRTNWKLEFSLLENCVILVEILTIWCQIWTQFPSWTNVDKNWFAILLAAVR